MTQGKVFSSGSLLMFGLTALSASSQLLASDMFRLNTTMMMQSWAQNDKPELNSISQPIKHQFEIEQAVAWEVSVGTDLFAPQLTFGPVAIPLQVSFANQSDSSSGGTSAKREALSFLVGFIVPDVVGVRVESLGVETSGHSLATDPLNPTNQAEVDFSTEVNQQTLRLYADSKSWYGGFSVGYRMTEKTTPQSLYVMANQATLTSYGVDPGATWKSDYLLLGYQRQFESGLNIKIDAGRGEADISSPLMSDVSSFISAGDASFLELRVEYRKQFSDFWMNGGYHVGYRVMREELALQQSHEAHLFARSESTFSGPYVGVDVGF